MPILDVEKDADYDVLVFKGTSCFLAKKDIERAEAAKRASIAPRDAHMTEVCQKPIIEQTKMEARRRLLSKMFDGF